MIILDTNVVSELMRPSPATSVVNWVTRQATQRLYVTAVSQAELLYGVEILPSGRHRENLTIQIEEMLRKDYAGRILPFDSPAARSYVTMSAARRAAGRPISQADCQIAAIAYSVGAPLATRNVRDFEGCGIRLINPWAAS